MCPAAQTKRGAVSYSTSGLKLGQREDSPGLEVVHPPNPPVFPLLGAVHLSRRPPRARALAPVRSVLICSGVFVCLCAGSAASAQLDLPASGVVAAPGFLPLSANGVLLSAAPDAAP